MTITMRKLYKVMTCTLYGNQIYNLWVPLLDRELPILQNIVVRFVLLNLYVSV